MQLTKQTQGGLENLNRAVTIEEVINSATTELSLKSRGEVTEGLTVLQASLPNILEQIIPLLSKWLQRTEKEKVLHLL